MSDHQLLYRTLEVQSQLILILHQREDKLAEELDALKTRWYGLADNKSGETADSIRLMISEFEEVIAKSKGQK